MKDKILKFSLIAIVIIGFAACGQKKDEQSPLLARPDTSGYLPFEMFSEDGKMYVRYIKDGKPLEKINIVFSHIEQGELWDVNYVFDEIIDEKKVGQYFVKVSGEYDLDRLFYISKKNDTVHYCFENRYYETKKGSFDYVDKFEEILESDVSAYEKILIEDLQNATTRYSEYYYYNEYDDILTNRFKNWILNNPATINYPFNHLTDGGYVRIIMSDDGNLRFYYWIREGVGGSLGAITDELVQYKDDGKVFSYEIRDNNSEIEGSYHGNLCYNAIYTVVINQKTYYLVESYSTLRYCFFSSDITAYSIENGKLKAKEIFKTKKGKTATFDVYLEYEGFNTTYVYAFEGNRIFHYDSLKKIVHVPLIENNEFQEQYLLYQLKDRYFEYIGMDGCYWFHPSIRKFKSSEEIFETKDFLIRIDKMDNCKYRYASWSKSKTMADKPDLIIENGELYEDTEFYEYSFTNNEYKYRLQLFCASDPCLTEFIITKNGKEILKEIIK